jgi:plasmid stabilization system protein ParE
MKPYTVVWDDQAIDDLAEIWEHSSDRQRINFASHQIDGLLRAIGPQAGEAMAEGLRCLVVTPLRAVFAASAEDCLVQVFRLKELP